MNKKPVKILVLTRYTHIGASSRLRIIQYIPYFKGQNLVFSISPFFNNRYLQDLYSDKKINVFNIIFLYLRRFILLITVKKYDLIWIEKEQFPYLPSIFESLITIFNVKYIVDYDDAIFHNYNHFNSYLFKNKFNNFLSNSSLVVVCNEYLSKCVADYGAKNIIQIPTVVDMKHYKHKQYENQSHEFRIGWIGSPSTSKYLYLIQDVLEKISKKHLIKLVIIGGSKLENFSVPIEHHEWSEITENEILMSCDVGIMPLHSTNWEKGKCGFKLLQYMASGLPVIASCVGFNRKLVDKKIGYLVKDDKEWELAFNYFIKDSSQIQVFGENARKKAEKYYALQDWSKILLSNIKSLINIP